MVDTTSSAPNVLPSWNVTPFRRLNVHTLAVASGDHFSARTGRSDRSLFTQVRYSATIWAVAIEPVSYMVVGSTVTVGEGMVTLSVPPALGALDGEVELELDELPQAARTCPTSVADRPTTLARTRS